MVVSSSDHIERPIDAALTAGVGSTSYDHAVTSATHDGAQVSVTVRQDGDYRQRSPSSANVWNDDEYIDAAFDKDDRQRVWRPDVAEFESASKATNLQHPGRMVVCLHSHFAP